MDRQRGFHRFHTPFEIPAPKSLDRNRETLPSLVGCRQPIPGTYQRRNHVGKPGQVWIECRLGQRVHREPVPAAQDPDGVDPARVFAGLVHVRRILGPLRAVGSGGRIRPVIGILDPPIRRVDHVWTLLERQYAVPFRRRITAVHGPTPVEPGIPSWNEVRMEVGNVAVGVGVDRIVGRVGMEVHGLQVLGHVLRLGTRIGLGQCVHRIVHESNRDPRRVLAAHDRSMMGAEYRKGAFGQAFGRPVWYRDRLLPDRALLVAIPIEQAIVALDNLLGILVDVVDPARRMHPPDRLVESLVYEELPPGDRPVGIESLLAHQVHLGPEEERGMRIDPEQRIAARRLRGRDREAVRPGGLQVRIDGCGHQHLGTAAW